MRGRIFGGLLMVLRDLGFGFRVQKKVCGDVSAGGEMGMRGDLGMEAEVEGMLGLGGGREDVMKVGGEGFEGFGF